MSEVQPTVGVKELKEMIVLAAKVVNTGFAVAKDGKVGFEDIGYLMALIPAIQPALDGAGVIPSELKDLSVEEAAELVAFVGAELALESEKAKALVEKGLKLSFAIYDFAKAF